MHDSCRKVRPKRECSKINYSIKLPMKDGIPELRPCRGALEFKPNCMDNCYPVLPETKMPTFSSIGKHVPLLQVSGFKGWDGVFWPCANQSALMMMMMKKTMNMNMNINMNDDDDDDDSATTTMMTLVVIIVIWQTSLPPRVGEGQLGLQLYDVNTCDFNYSLHTWTTMYINV